jgi:hypothetical protein
VFDATQVEDALFEVKALVDAIEPGAQVNRVNSVNGEEGDVILGFQDVGALSATNGGGAIRAQYTNVITTRALNLSDGSVQHIVSTSGNYTLSSPTGLVAGRETVFTLIIDTTTTGHTPTWFANITWATGAPPTTWTGGTSQRFQFQSIDGTNWVGWHLTPTAPIESLILSVADLSDLSTREFPLHNQMGQDVTIVSVSLATSAAATAVIDVLKNGATIFPQTPTATTRPTLTAGTFDSRTPAAGHEVWSAGQYLQLDPISHTGAVIKGVVTVNFRRI